MSRGAWLAWLAILAVACGGTAAPADDRSDAPGDAAVVDASGDAPADSSIRPDPPAEATPADPAPDDPGGTDGSDASDVVRPGCCGDDAPCAEGFTCEKALFGGQGTCLPTPGNGRCWTDGDCPPRTSCQDAFACSCQDAACSGVPRPGICASCTCCGPWNPCDDGRTCVGAVDLDEGICVDPAPVGECWGPGDCAVGTYCPAPQQVSCRAFDCTTVPPKPAACLPTTGATCCYADEPSSCGAGLQCVPFDTESGKCGPAPGDGECYRNEDCPAGSGRACDDAVLCICGSDSCWPRPGRCVEALGNPCCWDDEQCPGGTCAAGRVCLAVPDPGRCWDDGDCSPGAFCRGESFCNCRTLCGVPDVPGTCTPVPAGCCLLASDCGQGNVCLGGDEGLPGRCLPDPGGASCPEGGCCWTGAECPGGGPQACSFCAGASWCPCVEACPDCGLECPADRMGSCEVVDPCL